MIRIAKETKKEIEADASPENPEIFLATAIDAIKVLTNVTRSINRYINDYEYQMNIRRLGNQIKNKEIANGLETKYGPLLFNGRMRFKRLQDQDLKNNYYIMCFKFTILIFEIESITENFLIKWLSASDQAMPSLNHVDTISIRNTKNTVLMVPDGTCTATVQVLDDDFSLNQHESFHIYGFPGQDIASVKTTIDNIIHNNDQRPLDEHMNHKFEPILDAAAINNQSPPECGRCRMFVFGLLFLGYRCHTCNQYYHEECFLIEKFIPSRGIFNISTMNKYFVCKLDF